MNENNKKSVWSAGRTFDKTELPQEKLDQMMFDRDFDSQRLMKLLADLRNGRTPAKERDPSSSR